MPSGWIIGKDRLALRNMKWVGTDKADNIAALMLYIVLIHHANIKQTERFQEVGLCSLSYTKLMDITGTSRAKVAGGLRVLIKAGIVSEISTGRNNIYKVENFGRDQGWAKLPAKGFYSDNYKKIKAFHRFNLRLKNELNALKMYLLIVAFRNRQTNYAKIGYEKIIEYTGIHRNEIKSALSLLVGFNLIQIDSENRDIDTFSTVNMYRLCHLEPYKHRGTMER